MSRCRTVFLQVKDVPDAQTFECRTLFLDAFKNERVYPVIRPRIIVFKPFVDNERQLELICLFDSPIESVIILNPLIHLHPIKDIPPAGVYSSLI